MCCGQLGFRNTRIRRTKNARDRKSHATPNVPSPSFTAESSSTGYNDYDQCCSRKKKSRACTLKLITDGQGEEVHAIYSKIEKMKHNVDKLDCIKIVMTIRVTKEFILYSTDEILPEKKNKNVYPRRNYMRNVIRHIPRVLVVK